MNANISSSAQATVRHYMAKLIFVNFLTALRIVLAVCFVVVLLGLEDFLASLILLAVLEITDLADGFLARRWGVTTNWGAIFDPMADAISRVTVYVALVGAGLMFLPVIAVMAARDAIVGISRQIMLMNGVKANAQFSGKAKACVQAAGAGLVLFFAIICDPEIQTQVSREIAVEVSWFVMVATALSLVQYGMVAWKATKTETITMTFPRWVLPHVKAAIEAAAKDRALRRPPADENSLCSNENFLPGLRQAGDPW